MLDNLFKFQPVGFLKEDEEIFLFLRRHWFSFLPILIGGIILFLIPLIFIPSFFFFGGDAYIESLDLSFSFYKLLFLVGAIYFLYLGFFLLSSWLMYYLDVTIITNKRIIDIEQVNIIKREVSSATFDFIQDVRAERAGFWQRIIDFGTITIQTAGKEPNFVIHNVPFPFRNVEKILEIIKEYRKEGFLVGTEKTYCLKQ